MRITCHVDNDEIIDLYHADDAVGTIEESRRRASQGHNLD
jgi:hypothetical protein